MLGRIATGDGAAAAPAPEPTPAPARRDGRHYSPVVQRIAAEHDIDLASVTGTGRNGRVRKQDVLALVNGNGAAADPPMHIESPYRPDPELPPARALRLSPAERGPVADAPHDRPADEAVAGHARRRARPGSRSTCPASRRRAPGLGVTALAFVARATVQTLREFPALNAWLSGEEYARVERRQPRDRRVAGRGRADRAGDPPRPGAVGRGPGDADQRSSPSGLVRAS